MLASDIKNLSEVEYGEGLKIGIEEGVNQIKVDVVPLLFNLKYTINKANNIFKKKNILVNSK